MCGMFIDMMILVVCFLVLVPGETARLAVNVSRILSHLTKYVKRGNYIDGIPTRNVGTLGRRNWYWEMLPSSQKSRYLNMMKFIVQDKNEDYHLGDEDFQNTMMAGTVPYENLAFKLIRPEVIKNAKFEFPDKLESMKNTSKSNFSYSKLMQVAATYMNIQKEPKSRGRRYKYECPKCKKPFVQGTKECYFCNATLQPNGYPMPLPVNKRALYHSFKAFDQVADGIDELSMMEPVDQDKIIQAHMIGGVNTGYPLFTQQNKKRLLKQLFQVCDILKLKYDKKTEYVTVQLIYGLIKQCITRKLYLPYTLFYRTQGGVEETKHRCVFGAHFIQKWFAAIYSAGKELGYKDTPESPLKANGDGWLDKHISKRMYGVGGLPIMAQANWDEMFTAIKERMPKWKGGKLQPMSHDEIFAKFGVKLPPGDFLVNVIGDDFPGFDTGQIPEDFEELRAHKRLGWLFGWMIDDMKYSQVWTANKFFSDIMYKSGFALTSDFGSYLHRKAEYNAADAKKAVILAYINLSDDSCGFVIGLTPKDIDSYLNEYGLRIKIDDSFNFAEAPFIGFLKVDVGELVNEGMINICGNLTSRYYGILHQERNIEEDSTNPEDTDTRGIYKVTGVLEVDAYISKLASYGDDELGKQFVYLLLELGKDTPLGQSTILGISRIKADTEYEAYRSDLQIGFPPNWLASIDVTGLLSRPVELR